MAAWVALQSTKNSSTNRASFGVKALCIKRSQLSFFNSLVLLLAARLRAGAVLPATCVLSVGGFFVGSVLLVFAGRFDAMLAVCPALPQVPNPSRGKNKKGVFVKACCKQH
ncbi:hypothetical protein [Comamonas kerstersii]|uniref:hypothetical protein n=1 Tax=Comamonas kerstersii TaxID=225992 RepID=UPI00345C9C06